MVKLAIDLATRKIGVCALDENNNLLFRDTILLVEYSDENLRKNIECLKIKMRHIISLFLPLDKLQEGLVVGIELSNFKNPQLTQRFSFYAGVIVSEILAFYEPKIKMFNSNAWQFKLGLAPQSPREKRKETSYKFALEKTGITMSEDEADAFCIAYFLNEIETTEQSSKRIKTQRANKLQRQNFLYRKEKQINKTLIEISALESSKPKNWEKKVQKKKELLAKYEWEKEEIKQ